MPKQLRRHFPPVEPTARPRRFAVPGERCITDCKYISGIMHVGLELSSKGCSVSSVNQQFLSDIIQQCLRRATQRNQRKTTQCLNFGFTFHTITTNHINNVTCIHVVGTGKKHNGLTITLETFCPR